MLCGSSVARAALNVAAGYSKQKRITIRRINLFWGGRFLNKKKKRDCCPLLFNSFPNQWKGDKCVRSCLNYLWCGVPVSHRSSKEHRGRYSRLILPSNPNVPELFGIIYVCNSCPIYISSRNLRNDNKLTKMENYKQWLRWCRATLNF